jgi:hypothetical protein
MIYHRVKSYSDHFRENLDTNIYETDISIWLNPFFLINLRLQDYLAKIYNKQFLLSGMKKFEQI